MTRSEPLAASHVETAPSVPLERPAPAVAMLGGDELIELSLKPAVAFILIVSARAATCLLILAAAAAWLAQAQTSTTLAFLSACFILAAIARIAFAAVKWASRLYVLTNRRAMRFSGVLHVSSAEVRLTHVTDVRLSQSRPQRWLRVGTLVIHRDDAPRDPLVWEHIARPDEVAEIVRRAVRRARRGPDATRS